jgi:hypothetical protein
LEQPLRKVGNKGAHQEFQRTIGGGHRRGASCQGKSESYGVPGYGSFLSSLVRRSATRHGATNAIVLHLIPSSHPLDMPTDGRKPTGVSGAISSLCRASRDYPVAGFSGLESNISSIEDTQWRYRVVADGTLAALE